MPNQTHKTITIKTIREFNDGRYSHYFAPHLNYHAHISEVEPTEPIKDFKGGLNK